MTHETATPEKKALLEAFDTVLKAQAEEREAQRREAEVRRAARARSRPLLWTSTAILLFVAAYLWIEQPEWVFPARPLPESAAVQEASLRIGMANAAQHVERYRHRNGRLPPTLATAGAHDDNLSYEAAGDGSGWRLTAEYAGSRLVLTSSESLGEFLGNSFEVIARRAR